jgi:Na+/glutamate symporter
MHPLPAMLTQPIPMLGGYGHTTTLAIIFEKESNLDFAFLTAHGTETGSLSWAEMGGWKYGI